MGSNISLLAQQALDLAEAEGIRVGVSRLLIAAAISGKERSTPEIRLRLSAMLEKVRQNQPPYFYYDLGYYETLETTLESLEKLNWIVRHELGYALTKFGQALLKQRQSLIEQHTRTSLSELTQSGD